MPCGVYKLKIGSINVKYNYIITCIPIGVLIFGLLYLNDIMLMKIFDNAMKGVVSKTVFMFFIAVLMLFLGIFENQLTQTFFTYYSYRIMNIILYEQIGINSNNNF